MCNKRINTIIDLADTMFTGNLFHRETALQRNRLAYVKLLKQIFSNLKSLPLVIVIIIIMVMMTISMIIMMMVMAMVMAMLMETVMVMTLITTITMVITIIKLL